jgi:CheY-like chemotaxis protein
MINKLTIVMIDDDEDDLFLTKIGFRKADFDVNFIGVKTADDLFDYIKKNGILSIDLLLLDLNMPKLDGWDVLDALRSYPGFDDVLTFIFSTSKRDSDRHMCEEKGADFYMAKPSNAEQTAQFIKIIENEFSKKKHSEHATLGAARR